MANEQRSLDAEFLRGQLTYGEYLAGKLAIKDGTDRRIAQHTQAINAEEARLDAQRASEKAAADAAAQAGCVSGGGTWLGLGGCMQPFEPIKLTPMTPMTINAAPLINTPNRPNNNGVVQCKSFSSNEVRSFQGYCPAGYMTI